MIKQLFTTSFRFRLGSSNREWVINPFLALLFISMLYVLTSLGIWQLDRSDEKQALIDEVAAITAFKPTPLELNAAPADYSPVSFSLQARPEIVLVANEPYQGRDGYFVLQLAADDRDNLVWINRGWVIANPDRRQIPDIEPVTGQWNGVGEVYYSKGEPVLFENALAKPSENMWVLQGLSFERLQKAILPSQSRVVPYIIRLDKSSDKGFIREWQYVAMKPEKHLAYAIQWFGLALALTIIFIVLSVKRIRESN